MAWQNAHPELYAEQADQFIPETEVRCELAGKDLRQQGNGIKRDGQTSPTRDQCSVVG